MTRIPSLTVRQMREVDRLMVEEFGVSVLQMMELAGRVTARVAIDLFSPRSVIVLAGKGNNGGDGMVAARHLHNSGAKVRVVLAGELHGEIPLMQLNALGKTGIPVEDSVKCAPDLVIDALLGYGARGEPRGGVALLIRESRKLSKPVLSVDVPSGLEVSTGKWFSPAFEGATVLTLGLPKEGMLGDPKIKRLLVGDIGIPREVYRKIGVEVPGMFSDREYLEVAESKS